MKNGWGNRDLNRPRTICPVSVDATFLGENRGPNRREPTRSDPFRHRPWQRGGNGLVAVAMVFLAACGGTSEPEPDCTAAVCHPEGHETHKPLPAVPITYTCSVTIDGCYVQACKTKKDLSDICPEAP